MAEKMEYEQIEYEQHILKCPICKSKNINSDSLSFVVDQKQPYTETCDAFYCEDCNAHWTHIYTYSKTIITFKE